MGEDQEEQALEGAVPVWTAPEVSADPPAPRAYVKRTKTVSLKRVTKHQLQLWKEESREGGAIDLDAIRPKTRNDCIEGPRPCIWVGCKHHLYLDVTRNGSITYNFPDKEPDEIGETCALDVARKGRATLEQVADVFNLTKERIRQVEMKILDKLKNHPAAKAAREEHMGQDGSFQQGLVRPRYQPTERAKITTPEAPPPPKPIFVAPKEKTEEEPLELPPIAAAEPEEELVKEPEGALDGELPTSVVQEEEPMAPKIERPLTSREADVVKAYQELARLLGKRPGPSEIAGLIDIEGKSAGAISASICTALKAAKRKGAELPYFEGYGKRGGKKKDEMPSGTKKKSKTRKKPPEPAIAAEVVSEIPPTASMVPLSTSDAMKNVLLLEKEKLQKKLAAIDVLLTL